MLSDSLCSVPASRRVRAGKISKKYYISLASRKDHAKENKPECVEEILLEHYSLMAATPHCFTHRVEAGNNVRGKNLEEKSNSHQIFHRMVAEESICIQKSPFIVFLDKQFAFKFVTCANLLRACPQVFFADVRKAQARLREGPCLVEETCFFLSENASLACETIRFDECLCLAARDACLNSYPLGPAHSIDLHQLVRPYGVAKGELIEMWWRGQNDFLDARTVIADFLLDDLVSDRSHRSGLFSEKITRCG